MTNHYKVEFKHKAIKQLKKLPKPTIKKIADCVDKLMVDAYPNGCKKLVGTESSYRIRIGHYRVVYSVFENRLIIQIIKIGHRRDIYRN